MKKLIFVIFIIFLICMLKFKTEKGQKLQFTKSNEPKTIAEEPKLHFTTLTKPKELAEKASAMTKNLEKLPMVKSAAIYDYDEDVAYTHTSFEIELILKNDDNIILLGVKSDLTFRKGRYAGIISINKNDFYNSRLFEGSWPWIPSKDLAAVLGKKNYPDVKSFLADYDIIRNFLLDTPYGTKKGLFSKESTFYRYKGTDFMRN